MWNDRKMAKTIRIYIDRIKLEGNPQDRTPAKLTAIIAVPQIFLMPKLYWTCLATYISRNLCIYLHQAQFQAQ